MKIIASSWLLAATVLLAGCMPGAPAGSAPGANAAGPANAASPAPANAASAAPATAQACPDSLPSGTASLSCSCSAQTVATGSLWGSDVYTYDSNICRSALHAGAVSPNGGVVTVRETTGRPSYQGIARNGVQSSSWGSSSRSITFRDGEPPLPAVPAEAAAPAATAAAGDDASKDANACPTSATGLSGTGSCTCAADSMNGSVWGSNPYTADSSVCSAARHAGVIGRSGGTVRYRMGSGREEFPASRRNGIESSRWGSYGRSLTFR